MSETKTTTMQVLPRQKRTTFLDSKVKMSGCPEAEGTEVIEAVEEEDNQDTKEAREEEATRI